MIDFSVVLLTFTCVMLLLVLHELGHVVTAKIMGLEIQQVGFTIRPFPHFFVKINWPRAKNKRNLFLLSGFMLTLIIALIVFSTGVSFKPLLIAIGIQLIIETNPIYSDFVIITMIDKVTSEVRRTRRPYKEVYKKVYARYMYTKGWYLHFFIWAIITLAIVNLLKIYGI